MHRLGKEKDNDQKRKERRNKKATGGKEIPSNRNIQKS